MHREDQERDQRELHVERSRMMIEPISVRDAWNSVTTLSVTSESSASTSLVMREISTPAGGARRSRPASLQVREDLQPQVLQRALADPAGQVGLEVRADPDEQRADDECHDDPVERATSPFRMPLSIASFASGAGASDAAVPMISATNIANVRAR